MAADYKNRSTRPRKRSGPPAWVWFASGLLIGLFASFLLYLKGAHLLPAAPPPAAPPAPTVQKQAIQRKQPVAVKPKPEKQRPRFEFYDMLPEMEIPVTDVKIDPVRDRSTPSAKQYLLQVASFRNQEDADRLKARLILGGLDAQIQQVVIDGRDTWHRVRTGPYRRLSEMEQARNRLQDQGLQPIPLQVPKQ